jgi:sulfur-carrier protein
MSVVRIPPVLRPIVDGARELPASGGTVAAVLDDLFTSQPALAERLRPDGSLSSFVNVYVNGDDIRHRQGLDTPVGTTDVLVLLPAMAGGAGPPVAKSGGTRPVDKLTSTRPAPGVRSLPGPVLLVFRVAPASHDRRPPQR